MKSTLLFALIMVTAYVALPQQPGKVVFDKAANQEILYGDCDVTDFQKAPFSKWFNQEFKSYIPDATISDSLKPIVENIEIKIILGTWCTDSQREVPRFFKILETLNFPHKKTYTVCVNREKTAVEYRIFQDDVEFVPTFIILLEGVEIGRIVETPIHSLEKDMLDILNGKYNRSNAADEV